MAVDKEGKPSRLTGSSNHALIPGHAQRCAALTDEYIRAQRLRFPLQARGGRVLDRNQNEGIKSILDFADIAHRFVIFG